MELRVGNKYRLGRKIGSGSFGDIYLGKSGFIYVYFCVAIRFPHNNKQLIKSVHVQSNVHPVRTVHVHKLDNGHSEFIVCDKKRHIVKPKHFWIWHCYDWVILILQSVWNRIWKLLFCLLYWPKSDVRVDIPQKLLLSSLQHLDLVVK